MDFIEKLRQRITEEEAISLKSVKEYQRVGAKDAELNCSGEVVAFSIVKDIIEELETEFKK